MPAYVATASSSVSHMQKPELEKRIALGIAVVHLALAIPLLVLSGLLGAAVISGLPRSREGFLPLSVVLTFALFFSSMAWRGFVSLDRIGPAFTVRGWRLLACAFVAVGAIGAFGHWLGLFLPCTVAVLCLHSDPAMARLFRWIGLHL